MAITKPTQQGQSRQAVLDSIKAMGFSNEHKPVPHRLIVSLDGLEGTGKTHFVLTAPPPIFLFDIDVGVEGVKEKFQDAGKDIYTYEVRVPKGEKQNVYKELWREVLERVDKIYDYNEGTLGIDTNSELYELARLAHFGKLTQVLPHHYTEVKAEFREVLRRADDSNMNLVLVHKVKPVYVNNVRTKEYEIAGFDEAKYMVQVSLTMFKEWDAEGNIHFGYTINKCRDKAGLNRREFRTVVPIGDEDELVIDPIVNFEFLLNQVRGGN